VSRFIAHTPRGRRWRTLPTTAPTYRPLLALLRHLSQFLRSAPTTSASVSAIVKATASGCATTVLGRRFNVHTFAVRTGARLCTSRPRPLRQETEDEWLCLCPYRDIPLAGDAFPANGFGRKSIPALGGANWKLLLGYLCPKPDLEKLLASYSAIKNKGHGRPHAVYGVVQLMAMCTRSRVQL
jgi:hypothetical protein